MSDYIPDSDVEFRAWLKRFLDYASANLAALGLVADDIAPVQAAATAFNTTLDNNDVAQAAARAAREAKDAAGDAVETQVRPLAQRLQASGTVLDAQRHSLGLNVRSTTRTPVALPTTRPVATIDTSQRLQHTISFGDEETPGNRKKPAGVTGCEIWMKIGAAPVDPSELTYLATDTSTPYTAVFDGADAGKTVHYMLRWVNRRGERGPWSQTVSATITA